MRRQWTPLERDEGKGAFTSFYARAMHAQLHRYVDENGRIEAPLQGAADRCAAMAEKLAYRFGATPKGDRRLMAGHLRELVAVGAIVIDETGIELRSLAEPERVVFHSVESSRTATKEQRTETNRPRTETKQELSARNDSIAIRREENSREEKNNPPLNPPQGVGSRNSLTEDGVLLRLPSREHLGVDPHEVAANHLGKHCGAFTHFPGSMLRDFREATAGLNITFEQWGMLGQWFQAGGTRTHRGNRPGWRWLLGGDVLVKSLADARLWEQSGRPELGSDGRIAPVKTQVVAAVKPVSTMDDTLARLRIAKQNKATPEQIAEIKAKHAAWVREQSEQELKNVSA